MPQNVNFWEKYIAQIHFSIERTNEKKKKKKRHIVNLGDREREWGFKIER